MPRGYRYIVLATLGWLILAASPPKGHDGAGEQQQTQHQVANSLSGIDASLKEAANPSVTDQPCTDGKDHRDSDLCAQWKAADAAASAALAAWVLGALGLLVGGSTLIAAIMAARYAGDAAREGRRGADAAHDSLEHSKAMTEVQLRAHIDMTPPTIEREPSMDEAGRIAYHAILPFKNFGNTYAINFTSRTLWCVEEGYPDYRRLDRCKFEQLTNISRDGHYFGDLVFLLSEKQVRDIESDRKGVYLIGEIIYGDVFGNRYHAFWNAKCVRLRRWHFVTEPESVERKGQSA